MYTSPPGPGSPNPLNAVAVITGSPAYPQIRGTVRFTQTMNGVVVRADITGLPQTNAGFFGFHLHSGRCSRPPMPPGPPTPWPWPGGMPIPTPYSPAPGMPGEAFPDAGSHFNPGNQPHPRHAGDFPPLLETSRGMAQMTFLTDRFTLFQAIGKAVIIHLQPDDFTTQPSGNSGQKIACGMVMPEGGRN